MSQLLHVTFRALLPSLLTIVITVGCSAASKAHRHLTRAERYFEAGEYEKAKIEYLNVIRLSPQSDVLPVKRLGAIWLKQGAPFRAGTFLTRARELDAQDVEVHKNLARTFLEIGAVSDARREALAILDREPKAAEALLVLAQASTEEGDLAVLEQRIQNFPPQEEAFLIASATAALRRQDVPTAKEYLARALVVNPRSPDAHTVSAQAAMFTNQRDEAAKHLKSAADYSDARATEKTRYAEFLVLTGARREAENFLRTVTEKTRDFLPAWHALGELAFTDKKYDEAVRLLENVFRLDPDNPGARLTEAKVRIATGDAAKAVEILTRLNAAHPNTPLVKFHLAQARFANNEMAQAAADVKDAIAAKPDYIDAILLSAQINLRMGDAQAAITTLTNLLGRFPHSYPARSLLAEAYRLRGDVEESARVLREQAASAPQFAEPHFRLGLVFRQQGKLDEARAAFAKALELEPTNAMPVEQLIEIDLAEKRYDAATQRVEQQLRDPNSAPAHFLRAKIAVAEQNWDRAEEALSKAIELDPGLEAAPRLLVASYIAAGRLPQAAARLEQVLASTPTNTSALFTLALVYSELKEDLKAAETYEKMLAIVPDAPVALNNLAYLYAERLNRTDKAKELAAKAHTLAPLNVEVADTYGWILFRAGEYQQAATVLANAAAKAADNPIIQFHAGMANYMTGNQAAARIALERALSANVEFPQKEEARRRVALLDDGASGGKGLSVEDLQTLLKQQPDDVVVLTRLGQRLEEAGLFGQAADVFKRAFQLNPKLAEPALKLAQLYAGPLKDNDQALEFARKARELLPNDRRIAGLLGGIALDTRNFTWAHNILQDAVRDPDADLATLHRYAWAAYSVGKVEEATEAMQRVSAGNGDSAMIADARRFLTLIDLTTRKEDLNATERTIREILHQKPDYGPALMVEAALRRERGDLAAAAAAYKGVVEKYPDFAPAKKGLAAVYAQDETKLEDALRFANEARKALPGDAELAVILAQLSFHKGEHRRAIQLLQEAQKKLPLDAMSLFRLGMSQLQIGDKRSARDSLGKAVAAQLPPAQAADAQRALEQAGP